MRIRVGMRVGIIDREAEVGCRGRGTVGRKRGKETRR